MRRREQLRGEGGEDGEGAAVLDGLSGEGG